jgi:hypothetical protein
MAEPEIAAPRAPAHPHPPFVRASEHPLLHNTMSEGGARQLGARIEAAWARVGWDIEAQVIQLPGGGWVVRLPDLPGGLPGPRARRIAR